VNDEHLEMAVDRGIVSGDRVNIIPVDSTDACVIGRGGYEYGGDTRIYGENVDIMTHLGLTINGRTYGQNQILWIGPSQMGADDRAYFMHRISEQPNGIVLVFSLYRNDKAEDASIHSFFVSKEQLKLLSGAPMTFPLIINAGFSVIGAKYLYINYDSSVIAGHETNTSSGSNSGITFDNTKFVLRYVFGV
jgi:hypothetical protein